MRKSLLTKLYSDELYPTFDGLDDIVQAKQNTQDI